MLTDPGRSAAEKETGRIEAFSDGVFAIAITLLILEIKVPEVPKTATDSRELLRGLWDNLWPSYVAFFTSFITIGIMWINHHRLFRYIRRVDHGLLIFNLLLLLTITFVPFPTEVLAKYLINDKPGVANLAAMLYSGTGLCIAIAFNLLWRHIAYWGRLMSADTPPGFVDNITRSYLFGPTFYLVALGAATFNAYLSFGITMALALFFALPSREMR